MPVIMVGSRGNQRESQQLVMGRLGVTNGSPPNVIAQDPGLNPLHVRSIYHIVPLAREDHGLKIKIKSGIQSNMRRHGWLDFPPGPVSQCDFILHDPQPNKLLVT